MDSCVKQVMAQGKDKSSAIAICMSSIVKRDGLPRYMAYIDNDFPKIAYNVIDTITGEKQFFTYGVGHKRFQTQEAAQHAADQLNAKEAKITQRADSGFFVGLKVPSNIAQDYELDGNSATCPYQQEGRNANPQGYEDWWDGFLAAKHHAEWPNVAGAQDPYRETRQTNFTRILFLVNLENDANDDPALIEEARSVKTILETRLPTELVFIRTPQDIEVALAKFDPSDTFIYNWAENLPGWIEGGETATSIVDDDWAHSASAAGVQRLIFDRAQTYLFLQEWGIPIPKFLLIYGLADIGQWEDYPAFLGPNNVHGSESLALVNDTEEAQKHIETLQTKHQPPWLFREYIGGERPAREFSVALLSDGTTTTVLPVAETNFEVLPHDYKTEQDKGVAGPSVQELNTCPAVLDPALQEKLTEWSREIFHNVGIKIYGRVDWRLYEDESDPICIDINPEPETCHDSLMEQIGLAAGMSFDQLILKILDNGIAYEKRLEASEENMPQRAQIIDVRAKPRQMNPRPMKLVAAKQRALSTGDVFRASGSAGGVTLGKEYAIIFVASNMVTVQPTSGGGGTIDLSDSEFQQVTGETIARASEYTVKKQPGGKFVVVDSAGKVHGETFDDELTAKNSAAYLNTALAMGQEIHPGQRATLPVNSKNPIAQLFNSIKRAFEPYIKEQATNGVPDYVPTESKATWIQTYNDAIAKSRTHDEAAMLADKAAGIQRAMTAQRLVSQILQRFDEMKRGYTTTGTSIFFDDGSEYSAAVEKLQGQFLSNDASVLQIKFKDAEQMQTAIASLSGQRDSDIKAPMKNGETLPQMRALDPLDIYFDKGRMFVLATGDGRLYRFAVNVKNGNVSLSERTEITEERATQSFQIIRENGKVRWLAIAASSVLNRSGEIDSTKLFDSFVDFIDRSGIYPVLDFFHTRDEVRLGQSDFVARDGNLYISAGTFDDTEIARAAIETLEKTPDDWGLSISYLKTQEPVMTRVADGIDIPVYTEGINDFISVLPKTRACNLFTVIGTQGVERMKKEVFDALVSLVGPERAKTFSANVDQTNRVIDEQRLITRAAKVIRQGAAYEEGKAAAVADPNSTNPYPAGSPENAEWQKGFDEAAKGASAPAADAPPATQQQAAPSPDPTQMQPDLGATGTGAAQFCPQCGQPVPPEATVCPNCGYDLTQPQEVQVDPALQDQIVEQAASLAVRQIGKPIADLAKSVEDLTKLVAESVKTRATDDERIKALEKDEVIKRQEWSADLPKGKRPQIIVRPRAVEREAAPLTPDEIAKATIAKLSNQTKLNP